MPVKDRNGNVLSDGDSVVKDLGVKGASIPLKRGTLIKNIRLVEDDDQNVEGSSDKIKGMVLKACYSKKAWVEHLVERRVCRSARRRDALPLGQILSMTRCTTSALSAIASLACLFTLASAAQAASNVDLPPSACQPNPSLVFTGSFEFQPWQPQPSAGSGGASGATQRTTPGPQGVSYWLQAPASRPAAAALVIVLHGAGGAGTAPSNAMATRDVWAPLAESGKFLVAAPIASGSQGGWVPTVDFVSTDAIVADAEAAYDIDRSRVYLWGFSAGGHIAHTLSLLRNPNRFAAYAVNAGVLQGHAGTQAPALAPRRVPLLATVGDSDSLLSFAQADRPRFLSAGWVEQANYQLRVFAGGHSYASEDLAAAWTFFCRHGLLPPLE